MGTAEVCTTSAPSLANVASITYDLSKNKLAVYIQTFASRYPRRLIHVCNNEGGLYSSSQELPLFNKSVAKLQVLTQNNAVC